MFNGTEQLGHRGADRQDGVEAHGGKFFRRALPPTGCVIEIMAMLFGLLQEGQRLCEVLTVETLPRLCERGTNGHIGVIDRYVARNDGPVVK